MNVSGVVPLLPSAPVASLIDSAGTDIESSLLIVPVALPSAIVAPAGAERTTWKVSVGSTARCSPTTGTLMVCVVVVPLNVSVPLVAV